MRLATGAPSTRRWLRVGGYVLAVLGASVVADGVARLWYRTGAGARLHVVTGPGRIEQVVVVFPGFAMPGGLLGPAFEPYLGAHDALIVVDYGDRGVDMDDIEVQLTAEIARHRPSVLRVYGASMGGMCAADFLDRYRRSRDLTESVLVLDTAPADVGDLRRPARFVLPTRWYRGGPVTGQLWRLACHCCRFAPIEDGVDPAAVRAAERAFAATGTPALTGQAGYLSRFRLPRPGRALADRCVYLRGTPAGGDPVVVLESAVTRWRRRLPGLRVVVFGERPDRWHAPIFERPRETVGAILAA